MLRFSKSPSLRETTTTTSELAIYMLKMASFEFLKKMFLSVTVLSLSRHSSFTVFRDDFFCKELTISLTVLPQTHFSGAPSLYHGLFAVQDDCDLVKRNTNTPDCICFPYSRKDNGCSQTNPQHGHGAVEIDLATQD